jgi:5-methylthioadenosine/S-adenosylhomocysteine deaminase
VATLLIENGAVLTMDERNTIHDPGWVWVQDDRIGAVGSGPAPARYSEGLGSPARPDRVIDAAQMAVVPSLVNGHTHLSQTFMRGLADDKPLLGWLKQVMWPIQAAMTPDDVHIASLLGLVENLRCGAGAVVQHHKITTSPDHVDAAAEAARSVGMRVLLARAWGDLGDRAESPEAILSEMRRLHERWHGAADGRITIGFGPLAPWRCSDATLRRTITLAREWGVPTHIHVAEARDEIEILRQRTGMRHVEWLASLDALGPHLHLVHSVWIDDAELDLIAGSEAVVVHCPVSNMYLASGIAPLRRMLDRGIPVALGSDGPASHNSQDLLETLKVAVLLAKVSSGDARALSSTNALRMVTVVGAHLLGREDLGQIAPGAKADITLINLNNARSMPVHDPESALVYNASGPDVHTVIVDGRVLLDAGQITVLDEAALLDECRQRASRLLERARVGR